MGDHNSDSDSSAEGFQRKRNNNISALPSPRIVQATDHFQPRVKDLALLLSAKNQKTRAENMASQLRYTGKPFPIRSIAKDGQRMETIINESLTGEEDDTSHLTTDHDGAYADRRHHMLKPPFMGRQNDQQSYAPSSNGIQKKQTMMDIGAQILSLRDQNIEHERRIGLHFSATAQQTGLTGLATCKKNLDAAIKNYIELHVAADTRSIDRNNGIDAQMRDAKEQLQAILRLSVTQLKDRASKRTWVDWWKDADQSQSKQKTLVTLQRFAKNPALEIKEDTHNDLIILHLDLLQSLSNAFFVMMHFNAAMLKNVSGSSVIEQSQALRSQDQVDSYEDSFRDLEQSYLSDHTVFELTADELKLINTEVMRYIKDTLLPYVKIEAEKIGHKNDRLQFFGNALMALATAIALMVAGAAIVSTTGWTMPAAMMAYVTAIQASNLVLTALCYVAAKLSVDLTTAATVTALSTAGLFGTVGKISHSMGATPTLKRDVDAVVQNIEEVMTSPKFGH
ncbi:MAG: hypothetical protein CK424_08410 [Legionella sp.]|nr:MAG: hypothetical protein CK424_08410 [Legionella sp.]